MKNIVNTSIVYGFNSRLLHWKKTLADTEFLVFARVFAFLYNLKKYLLRH